jgi:hypothetical protein
MTILVSPNSVCKREQLPVVSCLLPVGQEGELMRPILDPLRAVVFALKYCPQGEADSPYSTVVTIADLTPLQSAYPFIGCPWR